MQQNACTNVDALCIKRTTNIVFQQGPGIALLVSYLANWNPEVEMLYDVDLIWSAEPFEKNRMLQRNF